MQDGKEGRQGCNGVTEMSPNNVTHRDVGDFPAETIHGMSCRQVGLVGIRYVLHANLNLRSINAAF